METQTFSKTPILRKLKAVSLIAGLLLSPLPILAGAADSKPTAAEVSKARAECGAQKKKVRAMESASANEDDPQLTAARAAWASACGHAQDLINAASGTPPPAPAPAPAPAADPNAAGAAQVAPAN